MRNYPMEYVDKKHILSQDERNQMGISLATKHIEISDLNEEKKARVSEYTAKIDAKKADISLLSTQINNGYVMIPVYAEKRMNFFDKIFEWWDPETSELVKTEAFSGSDYQTIPSYAKRVRNYMAKVWEWWDENTGEILKTDPFVGNDFQMTTDDVDNSETDASSQPAETEPEPEVHIQEPETPTRFLLGSASIGEETEFVDIEDDHDDDNEDNPDDEPEEPSTKKPKKPRK